MARVEKTIFISYRRKDISWALAVYQYLTSQKYDVFFDYTSIPSGDFEQIIVSNIKARAHFVLILTPTALDRCSEPGDWLRREIETAVDEKRNIIPLLFDGFNFASPTIREKLTGKLEAIPRYNALEIPSGYFIEAMERLSRRYLNIPLDAVIHPVSTEVRKVVKEEQVAVNNALAQRWEDIKELLKPAQEKSAEVGRSRTALATDVATSRKTWGERTPQRNNLTLYGIGAGVVLLIVLGIASINAFQNNNPENTVIPTRTSQSATEVGNVEPAITPPNTITAEVATSVATNTIPVETPTPTITPSPTFGIGSTMISPKDSMVLIYVPEGKFIMGLDRDEDDNPGHEVDLDAFWIDQTEVTNAMYAKCDDADICEPPWAKQSGVRTSYYGNQQFDGYPVIYISWIDANKYCEWAGRRLPTEAEWEKAARGNDQRIYPWGTSTPTVNLANFGGLVGNTAAVNDYQEGASPYGALNMAGNVWEWVADFYDAGYYNKSRLTNPEGPLIGDNRVMRGGSWKDSATTIRVVHRFGNYPLETQGIIGFRCASSD